MNANLENMKTGTEEAGRPVMEVTWRKETPAGTQVEIFTVFKAGSIRMSIEVGAGIPATIERSDRKQQP